MRYPIIVNNVEVGTFEKVIYSDDFGHALITSNAKGSATDVFLWVEDLGKMFRFKAAQEVVELVKDASITQMTLADLSELHFEYSV